MPADRHTHILLLNLYFAGSLIGSIQETQDCMDFCATHNIMADTKVIKAEELDDLFVVLANKNDTVIRHVLDITASNIK